MESRINVFDFTEDIYLALKDYFIAKVECGLTDITVTFVNNLKFKVSVEQISEEKE